MSALDKSYRKAVNVLRPNRARLKALHEEARISANAARDSVRRDLEAGADAQALYQTETDKNRRVVLVGVLRRGLSALDHD
jgi:hypothetical protein